MQGWREASELRAGIWRAAGAWLVCSERAAELMRVAGEWQARGWRAAGEQLTRCRRAADERLASGWQEAGERLTSGRRASCRWQPFGSRLTAARQSLSYTMYVWLARNWQVTGKRLARGWRAAGERLASTGRMFHSAAGAELASGCATGASSRRACTQKLIDDRGKLTMKLLPSHILPQLTTKYLWFK